MELFKIIRNRCALFSKQSNVMNFFTFNSFTVGIIFQQSFICILCIWYLVFHTKDSFSKLFTGLDLRYDTPISKQ